MSENPEDQDLASAEEETHEGAESPSLPPPADPVHSGAATSDPPAAPEPEVAQTPADSGAVEARTDSKPPSPGSGSVPSPIPSMRRIKLEDVSTGRSESAPMIETAEATYEELEDELDEHELSALEASPPPPSVEPVAAAQAPVAAQAPIAAEAPQAAEAPLTTEARAVPEAPAVPDAQHMSEPASAPEPVLESAAAPDDAEPIDVDEEPEVPFDVDEDEEEEVETVEEVEEAPTLHDSQPPIPATDRKPPPPRRSARPSLPKAKTPRKKPWWETLFGDDFSRAYRPMNQSQLSREVDFMLESLDLPKGAVILDLGCGQGEICVELSRRGYSVVGYDLSVYQLAMAGDNAQQAKQKINFLQGDMREMAFEQMFDAVICWDTSFGYFEDDKNVDVLQRVKKALKPNGRFLLDVMNRDFAAREAPYNHWFEGDGCVCMDDMSLDWITNRLRVKRSIILDDGRSKELQYSTRLYTLSEVGRMLHDVGFRVAAVSGDTYTKGAFFGPHSRRIIIQAGKP